MGGSILLFGKVEKLFSSYRKILQFHHLFFHIKADGAGFAGASHPGNLVVRISAFDSPKIFDRKTLLAIGDAAVEITHNEVAPQ